ncbi:MAG TPA: choline dehydrogenase [Hyphomicrobiaceae bacterium]|nr:choline dehydrogenase [Hyphomicrobiaceae bacterium]
MAKTADGDIFDYVIVGAGSAGCALASRLSEDGRTRVALVEAGSRDTDPWIHIPAGYFRTMFNPAVTWQYGSGPEPFCDNRIVAWPRGRVLGGSSAINGLLYVRGQSQDYDMWRQLGNPGWAFKDVLPYFRRSEDQERGESELHGAGGPLGVSDVRMQNPLCEAYIAACVEAGIPATRDFNGVSQEGAGYYQLTVRNGRRCSSAVAYLNPARRRHNLRIITDAEVQAITFAGRRANGIRFVAGGAEKTVTATREVILCAGAIGSPQLLEVSGIGAPAVLKAAGVDVRHELPGVGENMQDHYQVRFVYEMNVSESLNDVWNKPLKQLKAGVEYATKRTGILTIGAGVVGVFTQSRQGLDLPDIQFHMMPLSAERPGQGLHPFSGVTASVCVLRPDARGHIHIRAPEFRVPPEIISNYLGTESDRAATLGGLKLARRIAAQPSFARLVKREVLPGIEAASEDALMAFARAMGTTVFHPCGTCKMGQDGKSVVDERLRVRGIGGLRVVDASIMPTLISGNTNAPSIMIAEKASDMIREDARTAAAAA